MGYYLETCFNSHCYSAILQWRFMNKLYILKIFQKKGTAKVAMCSMYL